MLDPLDHLGIILGDVTHMMALSALEVEREPSIEIHSRALDEQECVDVHAWLIALPHATWREDDRDLALEHLLESRQPCVSLPAHLTGEATYFKVKWG